jgi:hypothetical protein
VTERALTVVVPALVSVAETTLDASNDGMLCPAEAKLLAAVDAPANDGVATPAVLSVAEDSAVEELNETAAAPTTATAVVRSAIEKVLGVAPTPRRVPINLQ